MTRVLRRLRGAQDDAGMSIPELLVTMFIMAMITTMIVGLVSSFSSTFTRDRAATDSTAVAAAGMKEVTRVVRSGTELQVAGGGTTNAPVFLEATANALTMHAFIDTDAVDPEPVKVRFAIDASRRVVETRWAATTSTKPWAFAAVGAPTSVRPVARFVPAGADPLFTYLDANNQPLTIPSGGFSTEQLRSIAAVQITLTVQADTTGRAEAVELQNAVGLPNRGISRVRS